MRRIALLLFTVLAITSCDENSGSKKKSKHNNQNKDTAKSTIQPDFDKYLASLSTIPLPFKNSTIAGCIKSYSKNYDKAGFIKFKHAWTTQPIGVLYRTDKYVVTMETSVGEDGQVPYINSYDKKGNKIDSLAPYKKTGFDMGYESVEYLMVGADKMISVIDSTKRWKLNKDKTDIIKNTMKLSVDTTLFIVTKDGRINKR
ncbi:hypothetical protein [Pinibacter soli]|uniref:Lipoprotein n=1 Tax=Pinibacter soli TaxID=3044211 RepID=A0ABT6REV0_9BACT|nr:hypothetical protein [Pinibacter soli]MDI3320372.1 hypothetical protein [Pinibacter soli]